MLPDRASMMARREAPRWAVLVNIDTTTPLRIWTGPGSFATTVDDLLDPSAIYDGIGLLIDMPAFRQMIGGTAERLEFTLDGTWPILRDNLVDPAFGLKGAATSVGIAFLDDDYQLVDRVAWFYDAVADLVTDSRQDMTDTISISITSGDALAMRALLVYWTDANHRRLNPTDGFFRRVGFYGPQYSPRWG